MDTLTALQHAMVFLEELEEGETSIPSLRKRVRRWLPLMKKAEDKAILELET